MSAAQTAPARSRAAKTPGLAAKTPGLAAKTPGLAEGGLEDDRPRNTAEAEVVKAAVRRYTRGEAIDMSDLAVELGVGRATLYRRVGNRDRLLGLVLADRTEYSFRRAQRDIRETGVPGIVALLNRFMTDVLDAEPLKIFVQREPLLFIRLATSMGPIETRSARLLGEVMATEQAAGRFTPWLPIPVLAEAIVRLGDAFMYAHLLGGPRRDLRTSLDVTSLLLDPAAAREAAARGG